MGSKTLASRKRLKSLSNVSAKCFQAQDPFGLTHFRVVLKWYNTKNHSFHQLPLIFIIVCVICVSLRHTVTNESLQWCPAKQRSDFYKDFVICLIRQVRYLIPPYRPNFALINGPTIAPLLLPLALLPYIFTVFFPRDLHKRNHIIENRRRKPTKEPWPIWLTIHASRNPIY